MTLKRDKTVYLYTQKRFFFFWNIFSDVFGKFWCILGTLDDFSETASLNEEAENDTHFVSSRIYPRGREV